MSNSIAQNLLPGDVLVLNSKDRGKIEVASDEMIFWCFSVCFEYLFPLFSIGEIGLFQNIAENLKSPMLYPASSLLAQECHQLNGVCTSARPCRSPKPGARGSPPQYYRWNSRIRATSELHLVGSKIIGRRCLKNYPPRSF